MTNEVLYICDGKMECNISPLCGDKCTGCCHTTDDRHALNKSNVDLVKSFLDKFSLSIGAETIFIEERIK